MKNVTEANLTLPEMADVAVDIRASCKLPLVLDAGGGWGDPVHVHRTVALAEAAGFAAIEIEDQLLPRRVEHHVGIDHLVPTEFFVKKLKEALAARTDPNLVIIARTNARRAGGIDEAIRRGEAFAKAGADMVFCFTREPGGGAHGRRAGAAPADDVRAGRRLRHLRSSRAPTMPSSAFAWRRPPAPRSPRCTRRSGSPTSASPTTRSTRSSAPAAATPMMKAAQKTCGLDRLLEIERRTMKG